MTTSTTSLSKTKSRAFGKDVYLLGVDSENIKYWLEAPTWDCDWYWGFGYIETFKNNANPANAKVIDSHQHATNFLSTWLTEWNGPAPRLTLTTFSEKEGWELSELFEQFYFMKQAAENFGRGKCHVANTTAPLWQRKELAKEINEIHIPSITKRILEILSPSI